jgi:hypothetical protein
MWMEEEVDSFVEDLNNKNNNFKNQEIISLFP